MNIDCLFNILLYSNKCIICNCLSTCKNINKLNKQYLYKLLYERDFNENRFTGNWNPLQIYSNFPWCNKYLLCNNLNKIRFKLNIKENIYELYELNILYLHYDQLTSI